MDGNMIGISSIDGSDGEMPDGGKYLGVMDGVPENDVFSRQESEQELCQECMKYSYIPSNGIGTSEDPNVLWIECSKCLKWYHAPCRGIDAS